MLSTVATVTSEIKPQNLQVIWNVQFITVRAGMDDPTSTVCLFGEKIGLLWKNVWLHVLKL